MSWTLTDYPESRTEPLDLAVLKRAELCGTLNKVDRKPQYQGDEFCRPEKLLKAVNEQGNHIRQAQTDVGQIRHQLYNLRLRNAIVVSVVTAALTKAPEIWAWLSRFFR